MEANQEARSADAETREAALKTIRIARIKAAVAQDDYRAVLLRARAVGVSVADIAGALGISRTAVYKQLGRKEKT